MKFLITHELALLIKTLRAQNDVNAKDLAAHVGKSPSYVSKLESGQMRRVDQKTLTEILCFCTHSADFYGEALPAAVRILRGMLDARNIVDQVWLMQYDAVERTVQVPAGMVADISKNLETMDISIEELVKFLNANIDSETPSSFPVNQMVAVDYNGSARVTARIEMTEENVRQLLQGEVAETRYFSLYNIVHSMFRLQYYRDVKTKLPPDDALKVLQHAASYMEQWDVHSLMGYSHFLSSDEFVAHQLPLAVGDAGVVDSIADTLREITAHDALHAVEQLNAFRETLAWDPAFALKVIGISFADLEDLSFTNKRALLGEIQAIVEHYENMSDLERKLESY